MLVQKDIEYIVLKKWISGQRHPCTLNSEATIRIAGVREVKMSPQKWSSGEKTLGPGRERDPAEDGQHQEKITWLSIQIVAKDRAKIPSSFS